MLLTNQDLVFFILEPIKCKDKCLSVDQTSIESVNRLASQVPNFRSHWIELMLLLFASVWASTNSIQ